MNTAISLSCKLLLLGLISSWAATSGLAQSSQNLAISPKPRDEAWMKLHSSFNEISLKGEAPLIFLGDSITQLWARKGRKVWAENWAPLKAANFGIGGDRTEHVIWRLQNGNFEGLKPKLIVLMLGTNNAGHMGRPAPEHGVTAYHCTAEQTAAGIQTILELLGQKLPATKVLLLGIFPRGKTPEDKYHQQNVAVNKLISAFHDGRRVFYMDIGKVFYEADGSLSREVMPDTVHLSEEGYRRWALAIQDKVKDLMK